MTVTARAQGTRSPGDGRGRLREHFADVFEKIADTAAQREADRELPHAAVDLLRSSRFGAVRVPVEWGGFAATLPELFELVIDLGKADPNVAQIMRSHFGFVEARLVSPYRDERERWLRVVGTGAIFANATTERGTSTPREIRTTLLKTVTGYDLDGTKYYSTGSLFADHVTVLALDADAKTAVAVVPVGRDGVDRIDDWDGMGQRLTGSGTTTFDHVVVHEEEVLAPEDTQPTYQGSLFQLQLLAAAAGVVENVVDDAVDLVHGRTRPPANARVDNAHEDHLLQQKIGQLAGISFAVRSSITAAAVAIDGAYRSLARGRPADRPFVEAAIAVASAQSIVGELALRACGQLYEVGTAASTSRTLNLDRHWRNVRTLTSHNPVVYKERAIGDYLLNDTPPPLSGF